MKKKHLIDRITIYILAGSLLIYLVAGLLRLAEQRLPLFPIRLSAFTYMIFIALCLMFASFLSTDVPNPRARFFLISSTILVFFWELLQLFRGEVLFPGTTSWRWVWYLYYFPVVFVPNTFFLGVMHSWQPAGRDIDRRWYLLSAVCLVMFLTVLTNDLHHLVIVFPQDPGVPASHMSFGPLLTPIMAMAHVQYVLALIKIHQMLRRTENERSVILLYGIIALAAAYQVEYILDKGYRPDSGMIYHIADVWGLLSILAMELAVRVGGIRSNFNFMDLFEASTASIAIEDRAGEISYRTNADWRVRGDIRRKSMAEPQWIDEDHRLSGRRISGGAVYWIDDLESVRVTRQELSERRSELEQEIMVVRAENDMIAQRAKAEEQGQLYVMLAKEVEPQLEAIGRLMDDPANENEDVFRENLAKACFYKVYVKRCCNLKLLQREADRMHVFELISSLRESMDYLKLCGMECELTVSAEKLYPSEVLLGIYQSFQQQMEEQLDRIRTVRVCLEDGQEVPDVRLYLRMSDEGEEICRKVI